jgi:hypothetical protein
MVTQEDFKVVEAMEKFGGSFVQALAAAFRRADTNNFIKLVGTFSDYYNQYREMAKNEPEPEPGHKALLLDLQILLQDADGFAFDDFKNDKYAMPKATLVNRLQDLINNVKEGKYDQ